MPGRARSADARTRIRPRRRSRKSTKCRATTEGAVQGFAPRGMDVDSNGVVWTVLSSGQLASFDRRKCKGPLNGPTATGQHCPEGWTFYALPRPNFKGVTDIGQRRSALLQLRRSVRHARPRQEHADRDRQRVGRLLALVDGKWVDVPRAVSDGLLREEASTAASTIRRQAGKGAACGRHQHARAVPHGDRQGNAADRDAYSAATGSSREIARAGVSGRWQPGRNRNRPISTRRFPRPGPCFPDPRVLISSSPCNPSPPGALPRSPS